MTELDIAKKYVYGKHDALTDNQEIIDMVKDITDLIKKDRAEQLLIHSVVVPKGTLCLSCEKETATHGIGQTKTVCGKCWNKIIA